MPKIPSDLGTPVNTRDFSFSDMAERAWGSEFNAPDHDLYRFGGGRSFDSTDRQTTGIYGVIGDQSIIGDNQCYQDERDGFNMNFSDPNGSLNQPTGSFDELVLENSPIAYPFAPPPAVESDPYFSFVAMLLHGGAFTDSSSLAVPITDGAGQIIPNSAVPPAFLGNQACFYQPGVGSNFTMGNTGAGWAGMAQAAFEPWTLEFSLYCVAYPAGSANILGAQLTNKLLQITSAGQLNLGSWQGMVFNNIIGGALPLNQWCQIALCYDGGPAMGTTRGFLNGIQKGTISSNTSSSVADNFSFFELPGANGSTGPVFRGGRKELRYTKGLQRYGPAGYTPRTTPFPNQ